MAGLTITVENLGKRFRREWIFRKLTRTFSSGIYAVVGPNGSGKSTLLQVLWGQLLPSSGSIQYSLNEKTAEIHDAYRHLSIATPYMDLVDEFSLREQIRFHFSLKPLRKGFHIEELPERMELASAVDKPIGNFSSGMRQRVKLALAFYTQSDALFLDEPGTNLDSNAFGWYKRQMESVPSDCLVFIASNQAAEYPENAEKINILELK
jgi:ABC-type multidrug transport system ATPase subunit